MLNWINRMFSDPQGVPDDARVWAFMLVLAFIILNGISIFLTKTPFSPTDFGTGAGLMAAAIGAMFKIRGDT